MMILRFRTISVALTNLGPREPAALQNLRPGRDLESAQKIFVPGAVSGDELMIEYFSGRFSFFLQELFHQALKQSEISIDLYLQPEIRQLNPFA